MQLLSKPIMYMNEPVTTITERSGAFLNGNTLKILEEMFTINDGSKIRKNTAFLKALLVALQSHEHPTYADVWDCAGRGYAETTKKQNKSWIGRSGFVEDDRFGEHFWNEYVKRWVKYTDMKEKTTTLKHDAPMRHTYDIDETYDYENTMDVIRENPHVTYRLPELHVTPLDYFDTNRVQILKMNHVGGNPVVQLPLSFHYRCNRCGFETDLSFDVRNVPCDDVDCAGAMVRVKSKDVIRPAFASRVITDDRNSISIISLTDIPQGEFIGAVFLCRNKADYYLFMIATEEIEPTNSTINIDQSRHAIWQIIDQIDQIHEDTIEKHIDGMDWYKAAILLAYLANCKGRVSTNVMIVGGAGLGKTSTPRLYMATITSQQKVQPMEDLTGPGLRGSTAQIKVGDTTINVPEPGLVVRNKLIVIDELLGSTNPILNSLKTILVASTVNVEVAGNRTQTPKYATAIAASNTVVGVGIEQSRWMLKWIDANDGDPSNHFDELSAHQAMVDEWTARGLEWHTGLTFPHIDRWPILFFINDPSDDLTDGDLDGSDEEIDDLELAKRVYSSNIDEYFNFCGKIRVDWKPHRNRIKEVVNEIRVFDSNHPERKIDKIHSKRRLGQNITLMLQLSAQINGRATLIDEDFDFVRELWSKTCEWIDVSELSHGESGNIHSSDWTIQTIKAAVHARMKEFEGSQKFYMTPRGFSLIAGELEMKGAPTDLVNSTVAHYKENPRQ